MTLELTHDIVVLVFRDPFKIARSADSHHGTTVVVELRDSTSGLVGFGEGFPDAYYGETPGTMAAVMPLLLEAVAEEELPPAELGASRGWLARADARLADRIGHHGAAKCAIDVALHDLLAKRLELPLYRLLGTSADLPPTDFTIGIDRPSIVAERAARAADFPFLKIKLGGPEDLETLEAVRRVFDGPIRVDANTGWEPEAGARLVPDLVRLGVELIEQPFPAHRLDQLRWLQERSPLPIVADESAVTVEDLDRLVGVVAGVNVKLAKCGGVGPAKRMLERARDLGFRRFLGCMEETSVVIGASAAVASLADWVDLDGNLLVDGEPFEGLELGPDKRWLLSERPGLGLTRTS